MKKTVLSFLLAAGFCLGTNAAEKVLFQSQFGSAKPLAGWMDVKKKTPDAKTYKIIEKDGVKCLETPAIYFGIAHRLSQPVIINDKLKKITLKVTFMKPEARKGRTVSIALTSRNDVALDAGQAFWKLRDSGFMAYGYSYSILHANYISYQVEGKQVKSPKATMPHNLLPARNKWVTWTLVYDNTKKTIDFFNDEKAEKPFWTFSNVKIDGIELRSVWICSWGTIYKDVKVTCETK